jgi:hypothetical protein
MAWKCIKGHEWKAVVHSRVKGSGCPYCSGKKPIKGLTDLQTRYPEIAKEACGWDPSEVMPGTHRLMQWKCQKGHMWSVSPNSRTNNDSGCPKCATRQKDLIVGENDLATRSKEIAAEAYGWDPRTVTISSKEKREWKCPLGHVYKATCGSRVWFKTGCPYCAGKAVLKGYNDLASRSPEIAKEAHGWNPSMVIWSSHENLSGREPAVMVGLHLSELELNVERDVPYALTRRLQLGLMI